MSISSIAGAHGFNAEGGNELFPTRGERAAGSCHSEVADRGTASVGRRARTHQRGAKNPLTIPEGEISIITTPLFRAVPRVDTLSAQ